MNMVDGPYTSRVSLYLKVANILRSRIIKGLWRTGDRLPTISALGQEFQVGRITIRQALHLLSNEGLITSRRGSGTFVSADTAQTSSQAKTAAQLDGSQQIIKVLEITGPAPLPRSLMGSEKTFDAYYCIRKLRYHNDTPYCLMDVYVAEEPFENIPYEEFSHTPVAKLISKHSTDPVTHARQTLTVGSADYETSCLLDCPMATPLAEIGRGFVNSEGYLLSRGHYLYRGDLFLMETEHDGDPLSDMPSGWMPDVRID